MVHRFAVFTACMAFLLIIAGGLVTSTGSGLSVPDWPLSFGKLMPPMTGGVFYEHGHRIVATFVGLLVTILAVALWRTETRRWVKMLGMTTLALVIAQGVLGGLTVLLLLPAPISVAHAAFAQFVFSLTVVLAMVTSDGWKSGFPGFSPVTAKTRRYAMVVTCLILVQLILGAWMRHSGAGLAIPDFPFSYGGMVPPMDAGGIAVINEVRQSANLTPVTSGQVIVNFAHRFTACLVLAFSILLTSHVLTTYPSERRLREPALVLQVLVLFQVFLGALAVWTGKGVEVTTGHVATGALILAASVVLSLSATRHRWKGQP